jgi:ferrochelatase
MKPDFADLMPEFAAAGRRLVLVVPVQFLADHLEILYDVDIGAREQAEQCGLAFHRIASLNAAPGLIDALAAVARETLGDR